MEDLLVVDIVLHHQPVLLLGELVDKVALLVPARLTPEEVEAVLVGAVGGLQPLPFIHEVVQAHNRQQSGGRVIVGKVGVVAEIVGVLQVVRPLADERLGDVSVLPEQFLRFQHLMKQVKKRLLGCLGLPSALLSQGRCR